MAIGPSWRSRNLTAVPWAAHMRLVSASRKRNHKARDLGGAAGAGTSSAIGFSLLMSQVSAGAHRSGPRRQKRNGDRTELAVEEFDGRALGSPHEVGERQ